MPHERFPEKKKRNDEKCFPNYRNVRKIDSLYLSLNVKTTEKFDYIIKIIRSSILFIHYT